VHRQQGQARGWFWKFLTEKKIAIGCITGVHGLKGDLKVRSFSGETDHFTRLKEVEIRNAGPVRTVRVHSTRCAGDRILMKLEGVTDRDQATGLSGAELWVDREYAAPLKQDEYYLADLSGLRCISEGEEIGTVLSIWDNGVDTFFEVKVDNGGTVMIPFADDFVGDPDIENRKIELRAVWLLE
jgi:16S rRNA processing protein RimM